MPAAVDDLTAAELDDLWLGYECRLWDQAIPHYWFAHQYFMGKADEGGRMKYGAFSDFLEFFQPPHYVKPEGIE